jgi:membrane protein YqaA with SNARE-associated domain
MIRESLLSLRDRGILWFKQRAHGPYAKAWLFFFSFTESSFLFIAPDVLLIAILLAGSRQWLYYGLLTTIASLLGAMFGYVISAFFFDTVGVRIVEIYDLTVQLETARAAFADNAFWVIFLAAFTPIPYKVFVLGAGFFKINFFIFLFASILGRGLRYILIAYVVHVVGSRATALLSRYSLLMTVSIIIVVCIYLLQRFVL